jgi:putative ABC transport system substrate-binding protein
MVASLARPGGNITGVANISNDIDTKLIEQLKNLLPALSHAAVLVDPNNPAVATNLKNIQMAAHRLGVTILPVDAHTPDEIERGFATMKREHVEGVIVPLNAFFFGQRSQIAQLAMKNRLPLINQSREETLAGGLLSYGPNVPEIYRRGAVYVDKILKGTKPSELPIEQPATFKLAVNLTTAKALGITIPQLVLLQADEVIQ